MSRVLPNGLMFTRSMPSVSGSTRRTLGRRRSPAARWCANLLREAANAVGGHKFGLHFLLTEWEQVVDAWQLERLGGVSRCRAPRQKDAAPGGTAEGACGPSSSSVRAGLQARKLITHAELFSSLAAAIAKSKNVVFDFAVVDEAQDISIAHLRFFAALGGGRPNALFFAGDLGQRIFQQPFSWKSLGVDIRGRSRTLRVNYRTSHQIRTQADRLLGPIVTDVDGNSEDRSDTVSVFNGPPPMIRSLESDDEEIEDGRQLDQGAGKGRRSPA